MVRRIQAVAAALLAASAHGCTTIAVGRLASTDGSTMATHNADCLDCDFRIGKVPAKDWPEGSMRPIVKFRGEFPRTVTEDRGSTWRADHLDSELKQKGLWSDPSWSDAMVIGHIPQVPHTFASLEGLYGIINEKQVAIGESTCGSRFFAGPIGDSCTMCTSLLDVSELSRIAMERASTAREAIQIMGDLAVQYGFYGSEWDPTDDTTYLEAAEALAVTDPQEAWIFHVSSDDTSTSAVWAAQRVPDAHISVVANQFTIRTIDPAAHSDDMLFSSNLWEVAQRAGLWSPDEGLLDFTAAFAVRPGDIPHYAYSTRRVWRVLDLAAPSLKLSPYTNTMGDGLPFSVTPDSLLSPQDILRYVRDHYEGTVFDMSKQLAAGPYGDVDRYDMSASLDGSLSEQDAVSGYFERSISLFRTSYSVVTQSRAALPDAVGALAWLAQYKPSVSTFVPMYVAAADVPVQYTVGSLFTFTENCNYWAFSAVGNWMAKARRFIYPDVQKAQSSLEKQLFADQKGIEAKAKGLIESGNSTAAVELLTDTSDSAAAAALQTYKQLFTLFLSKFHDGYVMETPDTEIIQMKKMFYPKHWLQSVGYFQSRMDDSIAAAIVADTGGIYDELSAAEIAFAQAQINLGAALSYAAARYSAAKADYLVTAAAHLPAPLPFDDADDDGSSSNSYDDSAKHSGKHSSSSSSGGDHSKSKKEKEPSIGRHSSKEKTAASPHAKIRLMDAAVLQQASVSLAAITREGSSSSGNTNTASLHSTSSSSSSGSSGLPAFAVMLIAVVCGAIGMVVGQKVHFRHRPGYSSVV